MMEGGSVVSVSTVDCCSKQCAQFANRDAVHEARQHYHNLPFARKKEFVYACFTNSIGSDEEDSGLIFDNHIVCPKAWYTIYGISKSNYHR